MGPVASGAAGALTLSSQRSGSHASSVPARASPGSRLSLRQGARPLRPLAGSLGLPRTELQHESEFLRAGAAAALALLDCRVWSATDTASRWERARRRQHALPGEAQNFKDWTRGLAGRQEEISQTAAPSLP